MLRCERLEAAACTMVRYTLYLSLSQLRRYLLEDGYDLPAI